MLFISYVFIYDDGQAFAYPHTSYLYIFKAAAHSRICIFAHLLMFGPLNRVKVDTFFKHFPKWRKLAQVGNRFFSYFNSVINFFFGSETA